MRVFVTDGENRATLAITRSLGRAGHEVIVGEKHAPSLAQVSRYCSARAVYPDPASSPDAFIDALASAVRQQQVDVLIPVADITTLLITGSRDRFPDACAIPFASAETVQRAADKVDIVQTAARLGVAVPRSVLVFDALDVPEPDFGYPVVIKPQRSRVRTADGWVSTAVSFAANRGALLKDLSSRSRHDFPVMLQERISGPGVGVFACYHQGRAVALFSHRRLRERPPWGGVSVLSESVALCPLALESATRLLDEIGWTGVAMVEFKRDLRDGVPRLMEINGRFWGSLQLAIDAGVDFPALLLQSAINRPFDPQPPYRIGVRSRWLWGDVDSLLATLAGRSAGDGVSRHPRMPAVLQFLKVWGRGLYYDNPKAYDVRPWVFESARWVRTSLRSAVHGGRARTRTDTVAESTVAQ